MRENDGLAGANYTLYYRIAWSTTLAVCFVVHGEHTIYICCSQNNTCVQVCLCVTLVTGACLQNMRVRADEWRVDCGGRDDGGEMHRATTAHSMV